MTDVPELVKCVALHSTILKVKAELDQLMSGLSEAGVLSVIQTYSEMFECLFIAAETPSLNAGG